MSLKAVEISTNASDELSGFEKRLSKSAQNLLPIGDVFVARSSIRALEGKDVTREIRRRATLLGLAIGTLLALLATGVARAQELTEEFHQQYPISADGSVRVKNVNGWIKIEAWDQNQVKVDAVKRAWSKQRLDEAKIVVEPSSDSIYIRTQYPDRDGDYCGGDCRGDRTRHRIVR